MKKQNWWLIFAFIGFFLSRAYILKFPPPYYSDVSHDYERYAVMWQGKYLPYLKHFFEYPPATIPLIYSPLLLQNLGLGHYYQNYRYQIFFFDLILFYFILRALKKLDLKPASRNLALIFYLVAPMIAKDFFYEGIDLVFVGCLSLALIWLLLYDQAQWLKRLGFWIFFWLSTAIKLLTAPLLVPYFFLKKLSLAQELKAVIAAFLIVWAIPLAVFRSSLAVMFVFHSQRGLKYASFPSFVVETINYFTHTETRLNQPPDFQLLGPVSDIVTRVTDLVFPLSILLVLLYACFLIFKAKNKFDSYWLAIKLAFVYIFTIFLTGKIFSQPFHIWYLPLIVLFPFKSLKQQLSFMFLAIWLLINDTTPWIRIDEGLPFWGPFPWKFPLYLARFIPMFILLYLSFKLSPYEKKS